MGEGGRMPAPRKAGGARMRLSKAVELFVAEMRVGKAPATATAYESDLRLLVSLATVDAADTVFAFTGDLVRAYFFRLSSKGMSMGTLHRRRASLNEFAKWGLGSQGPWEFSRSAVDLPGDVEAPLRGRRGGAGGEDGETGECRDEAHPRGGQWAGHSRILFATPRGDRPRGRRALDPRHITVVIKAHGADRSLEAHRAGSGLGSCPCSPAPGGGAGSSPGVGRERRPHRRPPCGALLLRGRAPGALPQARAEAEDHRADQGGHRPIHADAACARLTRMFLSA